MSNEIARSAFLRMNLRPVAVAPFFGGLTTDLHHLSVTSAEQGQETFDLRKSEMCASYGMQIEQARKPFAFAAGIAIIPITGTLINRFGGSYSSVTGYNFIRSQLASAVADPDVRGIVFDVNSYGGECAGCFELANDLREMARASGKKTMSVIDSNCYSAGYALGSSADRVVVTPTGGVGSIGVVAMHADYSGMLEEWGIKVSFIFAGDHKVDGNPYEPLPEEVRKDIQTSVDALYDDFVALVAANRAMDPQKVRATQARTYRAQEALSLGLVDAIASPIAAMRAFLGELSGSTSFQATKGSSMTTDIKPGAAETQATAIVPTAQATTDAKFAERSRISGILNCEEAAGRSAMAKHLAMQTDMSVDQAKALLNVAPKEQANQSAPVDGFKAAMNKSEHPNVGADNDGTEGEMSAAQRILQSQALATGKPAVKH